MSIPKYLVRVGGGGLAIFCILVSVDGDGPVLSSADEKHGGDIVFEVKKNKQKLGHSMFSHQAHLDAGQTCKDCHNNKVFKEERKLHANKFTMKDVIQGKACGACHNGRTKVKGKTVFAPRKNCTRCHSVKFRKRAR